VSIVHDILEVFLLLKLSELSVVFQDKYKKAVSRLLFNYTETFNVGLYVTWPRPLKGPHPLPP
jgi:hypothetical protein